MTNHNDIETKAASVPSVQPRFQGTEAAYGFILGMARSGEEIPPYGDARRDEYLANAYHREPILAGAISSMVQKMLGLTWTLTGGRNRVASYSKLLAGAEDGLGWAGWLAKVTQDYLVRDNGAFVELGRESKGGAVADIFHMDSTRVRATGNRDFPFRYSPAVGRGAEVRMPRDDIVRMVSMPSPEETRLGLGFCAVSRAIRAARLLVALHDYDWEKLSDLPPQGIAAITGLTETQVRQAMEHYEEERRERGRYTFPGVLWLASALPGAPQVSVSLTSFSQLPDGFDRESVVNLYVFTLALAFGVDAREFWPATATGATKADALVQAQKAKGKGAAELLNALERFVNYHVLPEGLTFAFDFQDDEEDQRRAQISQIHVQNAVALATPPPGSFEGILTTEEVRRLLVDWGVLPDDMAQAPEVTEDDTDVHEPVAKARWKEGRLAVMDLPQRQHKLRGLGWGPTLLEEGIFRQGGNRALE